MRHRVLVVDDDPMQAHVLSAALLAEGVYTEAANTGVEAIVKAWGGIYSAAVIDFRMPLMDGLAIAKVIRDTMSGERRPMLVALTGSPEEVEERQDAFGIEFDAIVAKPIPPASLIAIMDEARWPAHAPEQQPIVAGDAFASLCEAASASDEANEHPARVLVVDDDAMICEVLIQALQRRGFAVDTASDGFLAIQLSKLKTYDVVIMDYQMPHMDGHATAELIFNVLRQVERPSFISYTAAPERLVLRDAQWVRIFDELVSKASGLADLLETVAVCAQNRRRRRKHLAKQLVGLDSLNRFARGAAEASLR